MTVAELIATLSLKSDRTSFSAGERLIGTMKKAIAGIVAFKTVNIFAGMVQGTIDTASHLVDLAPQLGMSVEQVQQLGFAAEQSGLDLGGLSAGMKILAKNSFAANEGGKQQTKTFKMLGVHIRDADDKLRPMDEILGDVADRFKQMPEGPIKTALAMRVFGKQGATMIPLLNEGKEGIAALKKEFVELGGQIDNKTAASLENLGDKQEKLSVAWNGLKNQIAIALLPHLQKAADSILTWVKANREFIAQKVHEYVEKIVAFAKRAWVWIQKMAKVFREDLWPIIVAVADAIGSFVDAVGGAENAIRLLIAAWIVFKGLQMASFLGGLATKMAAFAAAAKGAGVVTTDMGNGVMMSMTKASGGMAKGVASLVGQAGLVAAAAAAGYAFGTLIDKVFDFSGKLSNLMVTILGDDAFGQQSEASVNARKETASFEGMSDEQVREFAKNGVTKRKRNAAFQELASRSSARDTRVGARAPAGAGGPAGGKVTNIGAPQTSVVVNMNGGDPKQVEEAVKKATRESYKELMEAQLREVSATTTGDDEEDGEE